MPEKFVILKLYYTPNDFGSWWMWFCWGILSNYSFLFPQFLERIPWRLVPMFPACGTVRLCGLNFDWTFPWFIRKKSEYFGRLLDQEFPSAPMPFSE
jgi:hypothetical protein